MMHIMTLEDGYNSLLSTGLLFHHHRPHRIYSSVMNTFGALFFSTIAIQLVAAQLLSAYDQAYGQWKIRLSRNVFGQKWHLEVVDAVGEEAGREKRRNSSKTASIKRQSSALQVLFPNDPTRKNHDTKDIIAADVDGEQANQTTAASMTQKPVKSVDCRLNLQRNGRFTLLLDNFDQHSSYRTKNKNECSINNYQPMHGEWFLTPNPYCVTDRHYDEIILVSEPRIRRVYLPTSTVVEKATVEFRCKLWGRYSAGAVRRQIGLTHGRSSSRMTHGTVLIVKEKYNDVGSGASLGECTTQLPQRDIVGTFCGRATDLDLNIDGRNNEHCSTEESDQFSFEDDDDDDDDVVDPSTVH